MFFVLKSLNSVPSEFTVTMTHPLWIILEVSQGLKKGMFLQYGTAMFVKSLQEISTKFRMPHAELVSIVQNQKTPSSGRKLRHKLCQVYETVFPSPG